MAANYPAVHWGGAEYSLYGGLEHWAVSDYDTATVVAALIGAYWGIKVTVV